MKNRKILIVGSGIAGPTLAYWLNRYGFEPTVVERAPELRRGGYVVDFWGVGYDVAERMGLLPALKALRVPVDAVKFVDHSGRRSGGFGMQAFQWTLGDRYQEIRGLVRAEDEIRHLRAQSRNAPVGVPLVAELAVGRMLRDAMTLPSYELH